MPSLLPNRLQKLRPVITHLGHAVVFGDFVGVAAGLGREGGDGAIGVALFLPELLGGLDFGGDVVELGLVAGVAGLQPLIEALQVFVEQLLGSLLSISRAGQGLDVVFNFVAGVGLGVFGRMGDGADQCQGKKNRFHRVVAQIQ